MNDHFGSNAARGLPQAVAIGLLGGILAACIWMLVFTQFAVVPTGTSYPDDWKTLSSIDQVAWLKEHVVIVTGFAAVEYMASHFSEYAKSIYMLFGQSLFSAMSGAILLWYMRRDYS